MSDPGELPFDVLIRRIKAATDVLAKVAAHYEYVAEVDTSPAER